ncbi:hypothetical protein OG21DRAFT_1490536 [Imleria badia]|nr:hypothetical protein OG21DRAFT_1490536 [Imleria badia]
MKLLPVIAYLYIYVDNSFSVQKKGEFLFYSPYKKSLPSHLVRLLQLWDSIGLPHNECKQVFSSELPIIGFVVDPNLMHMHMSKESKHQLITALSDFRQHETRRPLRDFQHIAGHLNWAFNVFPLLRLGLCLPLAPPGSDIEHELNWVVEHLKASDGSLYGGHGPWSASSPSIPFLWVSPLTSALNSYLAFCTLHHFDPLPTVDTLSFYVTFMCQHIEPRSVRTYLTGIVAELEPFYPQVREPSPRARSVPLPISFNNLLFCTLLQTGFFRLNRLGELVWPDNPALCSFSKVSWRSSVEITLMSYSFLVCWDKVDSRFEGSKVIVHHSMLEPNPLKTFSRYLTARDTHFPLHP